MRLLLLAVEDFVEFVFLDVEHHVAEHLNQAAIGVISEARIVAELGKRLDALIVQAEIENRVHHAGHGELRARTHADQQRILAFAEFLSLQFFKLPSASSIWRSTSCDTPPLPHVLAAGFGLNGEAGRHRQAGIGHLGEAGALCRRGRPSFCRCRRPCRRRRSKRTWWLVSRSLPERLFLEPSLWP